MLTLIAVTGWLYSRHDYCLLPRRLPSRQVNRHSSRPLTLRDLSRACSGSSDCPRTRHFHSCLYRFIIPDLDTSQPWGYYVDKRSIDRGSTRWVTDSMSGVKRSCDNQSTNVQTITDLFSRICLDNPEETTHRTKIKGDDVLDVKTYQPMDSV
jgi:hypothetical protein